MTEQAVQIQTWRKMALEAFEAAEEEKRRKLKAELDAQKAKIEDIRERRTGEFLGVLAKLGITDTTVAYDDQNRPFVDLTPDLRLICDASMFKYSGVWSLSLVARFEQEQATFPYGLSSYFDMPNILTIFGYMVQQAEEWLALRRLEQMSAPVVLDSAFDGGATQRIEVVKANSYLCRVSSYGTARHVSRELMKLARYCDAMDELPDLPGFETQENQAASLERVATLLSELSARIQGVLSNCVAMEAPDEE